MLPSGPGSAPMTAPHFMPAGSCAQFASRVYGLGRSLIGVVVFHFGSGAAPHPRARTQNASQRRRKNSQSRLCGSASSANLRSINVVILTARRGWRGLEPDTPSTPPRP